MSSLVQIQRFNQGLVALRMGFEESSPAFDEQLLATLAAAFASVAADSDVSAIVVCGSAGRFLSGADVAFFLECLRRGQLDRVLQFTRQAQRLLIDISRCPKPVTAWIEGPAIGGGLELALAADLRVAAAGIELAVPEVKIGTLPGWGGTSRLPALIGVARAKQLIFTGARIDAATAERWGLVNEVVPRETLMTRARAIADEIAANAPISVQLAKQAIEGDRGMTLEAMASALAATTDDAREGIASFREKRAAEFTGR